MAILNFSYNKKGNAILDSITALITIIVFVLMAVFVHMAFGEANQAIQDEATFSNLTKETSQNTYSRFPVVMDSGFLMILILLWIFGIVTSFLIDSHPAFFILTIILLILMFVACMFLGNAVESIFLEPVLAGESTSFPIMFWVMTHLMETFLPISFTIAFSLFAKFQWG